jgi:hypothetical protein
VEPVVAVVAVVAVSRLSPVEVEAELHPLQPGRNNRSHSKEIPVQQPAVPCLQLLSSYSLLVFLK